VRAPILALVAIGCLAPLSIVRTSAQPTGSTTAAGPQLLRGVLDTYCIGCHNQRLRTGGMALDSVDPATPGLNPDLWERVIAKLRAGSMPPPGRPRPNVATYRLLAGWLETEIDREWTRGPHPGPISAVHRLNRTEYNNSIRDLFAFDAASVDVRPLLPGDETADGSFDNFGDSLSISPAHLERYLSVARQVTRLAIGLPPAHPEIATFEIPLHVLQDDRQGDDLPLGSRGGLSVHYSFPVDGEYVIKVRLQRQYQDYIKGMGWPQQLDVRVDGKLLKRFAVGGQAQGRPAASSYAGDGEPGFAGDDSWEKYMQVGGDAGLEVRAAVRAGSHVVAASFVRELWEPEGLPQPLQRGRVITDDQVYMGYASVGSMQIGGPYSIAAVSKDAPTRRAIFVCEPAHAVDEKPCAARIISRMARLAYRRPAADADVSTLMEFYDARRLEGGDFDAGIQFALERMLVDPDFLLRVHPPSPDASRHGVELASRLSFFLWGTIPDDRLLTLAERGELSSVPVLEREARRMLADPRAAAALVDGFAAQWLNLRRVDDVVVDPERYPNYDLSLMQAMRRETELFVDSTIRDDRSVVDLLDANYTFVNERLARHYGISGVYGSRFRRVTLPDHDRRGGLLAQGALLATTSYPDRTSPVLRGKWLLNNIFGLAVPPPPPGVDTTLNDKPGARPTSIRERLAEHRTNPSCNACHATIDPLGFALENFDVIGGWRSIDESGNPVDARGTTSSGASIEGLSGLRAVLLEEPDRFPRTVTEKLLSYALGRRLEYSDRPAVRTIVRAAAADGYRWSSIVLGIVKSPEFLR
jgi:hypothetical protein